MHLRCRVTGEKMKILSARLPDSLLTPFTPFFFFSSSLLYFLKGDFTGLTNLAFKKKSLFVRLALPRDVDQLHKPLAELIE